MSYDADLSIAPRAITCHIVITERRGAVRLNRKDHTMPKEPAFPSKVCEPEFASIVARTTLPLRVLFTFVSHVTAHAKAAVKSDGLMAKACDAMIADKVTVAMFAAADKSDKAVEFRDALKVAIVASFSMAFQQLLDTPTKGLSDAKKAQKRYLQQQIGARVNDYKRGLERRLNGPAKKGADQKRTDDRTFIVERLTAIIKRCEKAEGPGFDVVAVIETCRSALGKVQTKI